MKPLLYVFYDVQTKLQHDSNNYIFMLNKSLITVIKIISLKFTTFCIICVIHFYNRGRTSKIVTFVNK